MSKEKQGRSSSKEIQGRKINVVKERDSQVPKINSPMGATIFDILLQFDMAFAKFKNCIGEADGPSFEKGETVLAEGLEIIVAFSDFTAKFCKVTNYRYLPPREIDEFIRINLPSVID